MKVWMERVSELAATATVTGRQKDGSVGLFSNAGLLIMEKKDRAKLESEYPLTTFHVLSRDHYSCTGRRYGGARERERDNGVPPTVGGIMGTEGIIGEGVPSSYATAAIACTSVPSRTTARAQANHP